MSDSFKNIIPSSGGNLTYKYDMLDCRGDKNVQWAMDGDSDWFTVTESTASKTLNVSASAISGDEEKSLIITPMVNGDRCPQDITISQKGCGVYIKSIMEYPHLRRHYDDDNTEYLRERTVMVIELKNANIQTRNLKIEVSGDIEDILDTPEFRRYYSNLRLGAILKIKEYGTIIEDKTYTGTVKVSYEVKNPTDTDYSICSHVLNVDYRPVSCNDFTISGVTSGGTLSGVTLENGVVNRIPFTSVNDVTLKNSSFWTQKYPSAPIEYIDWSGTIDYDYTTNEILITPRFSGYELPTDGYFTFAIRSGYDSETETKLYSCDIKLEPRFIGMGCHSVNFEGVVRGELVFESNVSSFSASTNELIGFSLRYDGLKVSAETHNAFDSYDLRASSDFNKALFYGESYYQNCETIKYEDSTDIVHISILRSMPSEWCNLTLKVTKKGKSCECEDITVKTYDAKVTEWRHNILSSMTFSFLSNQSSGFTYYYTKCGEVEPYIEKSAYIDINEEIVKECDDFVSLSFGDCKIQDDYYAGHYCDMGCNGTIITTSNNVLEVDGQLYTRRCWIGYKVKNHWGEECESLPGFTVDQKPIVCGCDSMNYFVDRARWTFDENGYDGKFLVMSASTQGCGILSALTEADMLVNGKTYLEYSTDELGIPSGNCYVWSDGILPDSGQPRTTYVFFYLKPKGSSKFISCSKAGVPIIQDRNIKTCSDYDLTNMVYPTITAKASSTGFNTIHSAYEVPYETYIVGGKEERYIYYYAESNVDWMQWLGRIHDGRASSFDLEINRGEARTGVITHYVYKDCSDYEYVNGEIVGVKGGYLCSSATTVVTQEAMKPCLCTGFSYTTTCETDFDVNGKRGDSSYGYIWPQITAPEGCRFDYPYYYDIEYSSEEVDWLNLDQDGYITVSPNHATESADTQSRSADVWWDLYLRDPEGVEEPIRCGGGSCTVTQEGETCNCNTIMKYADYGDTDFDENGGSTSFSLGDPCGGKITSAVSKDPDWILVSYDNREVSITVDPFSSSTMTERGGEVEIAVSDNKGNYCDYIFHGINQKKKCDCSYSTMSVTIDSSASGYPGEEINIGTISSIPHGETGSCLSYSVDGASVDVDSYDGNLTTTVPSDKSSGDSYTQNVTVTLKEGDKVCNTWSGTCTITVTEPPEPPCIDFAGDVGTTVELCRGESIVVATITIGDYCQEFSANSTSSYLSGSIDTSTGEVSVSLSSDGGATGGSVDFYYGGKSIGQVYVAVKADCEGEQGE